MKAKKNKSQAYLLKIIKINLLEGATAFLISLMGNLKKKVGKLSSRKLIKLEF